ncbi:MAG: hypothetical protein WA715_28640 [Candidatus Acidiferrum sp.]|jgi:hypothetical protein
MTNSNNKFREAQGDAVGRRDFLTKAVFAGATVALGSVPSAASSIAFTPEEFKELNAAVADIHVQGQRLPDGVLALSGVEAPPKS